MKKIVAANLIFVLYLLPIGIYAQKRTVPVKPKAPIVKPETSASVQSGKPTYLKLSAKSEFLSRAWTEGKLPAPFELPADETKYSDNGTLAKFQRTQIIDQNADLLAKMTTAGDEKSASAIVAAFLEMGFAIDRQDGTRQKTSGAQGIAIPEWQIAGAMKLYGQENGTDLKTFEIALKKIFPQLKDINLAELLVADIREAAESDIPAKRFWADYVINLGKNSSQPYDLTNPGVNLEKVRIDPLQNLLILTRLAFDSAPAQKNQSFKNSDSERNYFQNVSYSFARTIFPVFTSLKNPADVDCSIDSNTSVAYDYDAIANGTVFTKAIEAFKDAATAAGKAAKAAGLDKYATKVGFINMFLNLAKFIITYASITVKITLEGDSLTRTKTMTVGERKELQAEVSLDTGKYPQIVNCVRPLLNLFGLDAAVPTNGPLSNINVTWVLLGDDDSATAAFFKNLSPFAKGNEHNSERVNGVYLGAAANHTTDGDGIARIDLVGAAQERDLSREKVTRKTKSVRVQTYFQMKSTNLKTTADYVGTIGDFLGPAISLMLGDKLSGGLGLALEAAYRVSFAAKDPQAVTVIDWVSCEDGWEGTITKISEYSNSESRDSGKNTVTESYKKSVTVTLEAGKQNSLNGFAAISISGKKEDKTNKMVACYQDGVGGKFIEKSLVNTTLEIRSISGKSNISGSVDISNNRYSISLRTENPVNGLLTFESSNVDECNPRANFNRRQSEKLTDNASITLSGDYNPNDPYILKGSKTVQEGVARTTYTWELHKCH